MKCAYFRRHRGGVAVVLLLVMLCPLVSVVADDVGAPRPPAAVDDVVWTQRVVEAYQDLQAQQKLTRDAIEKARQEAAAAGDLARRNAEEVAKHFQDVEAALTTQRTRDLAALEQSHRFSLTILGTVAGVGFVGLLLLAGLLIRAMNRRSAPAGMAGGQGPVLALGGGDNPLLALNPAEQSSARFLGAVERLEQRIAGMEADAHLSAHPELAVLPLPARDEKADRAALLLGKGQTLLNLDQTAEAIAVFDQAIATDPDQAEAYVKKGKALEKLEQLEEALAQYDRAIALEPTLTIAYLYKGGLLNRLERFTDALACYEQALDPQDRPGITQINA